MESEKLFWDEKGELLSQIQSLEEENKKLLETLIKHSKGEQVFSSRNEERIPVSKTSPQSNP